MRFAYLIVLLLLSVSASSCYNHRPFNPQKKKPFVASKVKVSKPYTPSKGPRSNLPYKADPKTPKINPPPNKNDNDDDEDPQFLQELLEYR